MPRVSSGQRLIGILQQMLDTVCSRTVASHGTHDTDEEAAVRRQRRHVEWLCDHDINAFRIYTHADMVDSRVLPLCCLPRSLTWGFRNGDSDTLYYGSRPFVFYFPAKITYLTFEEVQMGQHRFELELSPLALQDIIALDVLAGYARPVDREYPRRVFLCSIITDDDDIAIFDVSSGAIDGDVCWTDTFVDDYVVAEVQVSRVFHGEGTWQLQYKLVDATRVASTP